MKKIYLIIGRVDGKDWIAGYLDNTTKEEAERYCKALNAKEEMEAYGSGDDDDDDFDEPYPYVTHFSCKEVTELDISEVL